MSATDGAFRQRRLPRVRAYVERVCLPDAADEAASAAFVDFLARAGTPGGEAEPDALLLQATRSATASRFAVAVPMGHPELVLSAECRAMPELLAAYGNRERSGDEQLIADHLAGCPVCAHTLTRMQAAEQAFAAAAGELPPLEIEETAIDTTVARPRREGQPLPERETGPFSRPIQTSARPGAPVPHRGSPPAPYRGRSGGLVGAIRKFGRAPRA